MMPVVITVGLLGVAVGLYRRIGMLWLLLTLSILLVPTVRLFAGGAILAVLSTTAAWLVALQIGYVIGLLVRWKCGSALSAHSKVEFGENGASAERPDAKTSTN